MSISSRKIAECTNCGDEREIAAHGLCFKCYRAADRAAENPWAAAAKHERAKLKAQRRLRTAVTGILNAVDNVIDLMDEEHVSTVRSISGHYITGLASGLLPVPKKIDGRVNSEQVAGVHSSQQTNESSPVNGERALVVNSSQTCQPSQDVREEHGGDEPIPQKAVVNSEQPPVGTTSQKLSKKPPKASTSVPGGALALALSERMYPSVRPHPRGGYGVYDGSSSRCVQQFETEDEAWDAIAAANAARRDAVNN